MNYDSMLKIVREAQTTALFAGMTSETLRALFLRIDAYRRTYRKGEFIEFEGMRASTIYAIVSGRVLATLDVEDGRKHVGCEFHDGDAIGLALLYCDGANGPSADWADSNVLPCWQGTFQAVEETIVIGFNVLKARKLSASGAQEFHQVFLNALYLMSRTLLNVWRKQVSTSGETAEDRVMLYLRRVDYETGASGVVEVPFNQGDWANYLCLGRSTLCRAIRNLKRQGRIDWIGRRFLLGKDIFSGNAV